MTATSSKTTSPFMRGLSGLLLLLPALGLCALDQLWLTIATFINSLKDAKLGYDGEFVGFTNYGALFTTPLSRASLAYTILFVIVRILSAGILPVLLAFAIHRFGKRWNRAMRLWFTLPLAYFGPTLAMFGPSFMREIWKPESMQRSSLLIDSIVTLAVACGIGVIVYLAVLRGQKEDEKIPTATLVSTWLVTQLAVAAYALQSLNTLSMLTPGRNGSFVLGHLLLQTIRTGYLGLTSSVSTVLFLLTAILGIIAAFVLLTGKIQLSYKTDAASSPALGGFSVPGMIALLVGALAVLVVTLIPLGMSLVQATEGSELPNMLQLSANTILPALLTILFIQIPVAYLGALGISIAQPFGKVSQWILLAFSPWLFVTAMPLALATFQNLSAADALGSPLALTPPILLNIPMLFLLSLFFKGQSQAWQAAGKEGSPSMSEIFKHWILPSLPLALLMATLSVLVAAQEVFMPFMVGIAREQSTIALAVVQLAAGFTPANIAGIIALFGIPFFFITFAIIAVLQVTYLHRLTISREA